MTTTMDIRFTHDENGKLQFEVRDDKCQELFTLYARSLTEGSSVVELLKIIRETEEITDTEFVLLAISLGCYAQELVKKQLLASILGVL